MVVDLPTQPTERIKTIQEGAHLNFISNDDLADRLSEDFGELQNATEPDVPSPESSPPNSPVFRKLLLIDLRSMFLFQESHVRESINLTNCPLVCKRIQDGKMQIKEYLEARLLFDGSQDVVIYEQSRCHETDDCSDEEEEDWSGITEFAKLIFMNLQKCATNEDKVKILKGGFDSFRQCYPKHCTQGVPFVARCFISNLNDDETTYLNWEATEVRENIYIGALHDAKNDELLDRLNITHILNCSRTVSRNSAVCDKYKYKELQCEDNLKQSLDGKLADAFTFINEALEQKGKVLIHCYAGVSRSAAITIAYMMYAFNLSYQDSYRELKTKRSIVAPNINFVSQLMKFDDQRRSKALTAVEQPQKSESRPRSLKVTQPPLRKESTVDNSEMSTSRGEANLVSSSANSSAGITGNAKVVGGLAAKRKLMTPLKLSVAPTRAPAARFDNIASAPIMPANYNPFCSAFKKANSKNDGSSSNSDKKCPFGSFQDSIPE